MKRQNAYEPICEAYYSIACIYEETIEYKEDETASEAEEYHLKILEIQPKSAFHHQRYAEYLENYQRNYVDGLDWYMKVEKLIDSGADDWMNRSADLFDCYSGWFDCLVELETYKEAETLCLRWIKSVQDSNKKDCHLDLKHAYNMIIRLYKDYLKQPEAANLYSSMRSKLCT
eukprot:1006441_1